MRFIAEILDGIHTVPDALHALNTRQVRATDFVRYFGLHARRSGRRIAAFSYLGGRFEFVRGGEWAYFPRDGSGPVRHTATSVVTSVKPAFCRR